MLKRNIVLLSAAIGLAAGAVIVSAQEATPEMTMGAGPDTITVNNPAMMPEGIEFDPTRGQFLLGSLNQNSVSVVADDGTLTTLIQDPKLASIVGLEVDAERNRILFGSTDRAAVGQLGIYDLATGAELHVVDLAALTPDAAGHFPNDVAVDADGNAYVTDSAAGVIYKVDVDGNASIFLQDISFVGNFVLNGIAYNPNGYLVAVRGSDLIKIPLDAPETFSVVAADGDVGGGDGIIFADANTLVAAVGDPKHVIQLTSDDDFATATITGDFQAAPDSVTTIALRDGEAYAIDAKFSTPDAESYTIKKVTFSEPMMAEATAEMGMAEMTPEPTAAG
ncbi:MAG: SMP-30/gluconolactonase/LRE family protein [Chloroflexi bacterium]|nr:SMP-30/gluconolactonase/LRE family protein [Chloroflexota bacterium]MCC6895723.1 SMP-30/gluconolactonase/LRE family protein [Anaerolineae bacterium]